MTESSRADFDPYVFSGGPRDGKPVPLRPGELLPHKIQHPRAKGEYVADLDRRRYVWIPADPTA